MNKSKIYKSKKDDGYTPLSVIEYVKKQMGNIDLDPATTSRLAKIQGIKKFYTKKTNGLTKSWGGNVGLNPPFSNKIDGIKKARQEIDNGNVKRLFILLPMALETDVGQSYILGKAKIHIPDKRISFIDGETMEQMEDDMYTTNSFEINKTKTPPFGTAIVEMTKEPVCEYCTFTLPTRGNQ